MKDVADEVTRVVANNGAGGGRIAALCCVPRVLGSVVAEAFVSRAALTLKHPISVK